MEKPISIQKVNINISLYYSYYSTEQQYEYEYEYESTGLTAITGKWAVDFSKRLANGGLACHVLDKTAWEVAMFEKLIWISAFMIVGSDHGGCTVGEVESKYKDEVNIVISELATSITKVCTYMYVYNKNKYIYISL